MSCYLLDTNMLVALLWPSHEHHDLGVKQVTDAYLLGLAIRRGGMLATLDQRIAALTEPKTPARKALEIIA